MAEYCHRCEGLLPTPAPTSTRDSFSAMDPEAMLFCPHCSAPQIRLPEHLKPVSAVVAQDAGTGALPPPHYSAVDWPAALRATAQVAGISAVLLILGAFSGFVSLVSVVWLVLCPAVSIALYKRQRSAAWMDRRVGGRIGFVTGLLVAATLGLVFAGTGVIKRFGVKDMGQFDQDTAEQTQKLHATFAGWMKDHGQTPEEQKEYDAMINSPQLNSPEARAGGSLFALAVEAGMLVLMMTATGALTGSLRGRGRAVAQGN